MNGGDLAKLDEDRHDGHGLVEGGDGQHDEDILHNTVFVLNERKDPGETIEHKTGITGVLANGTDSTRNTGFPRSVGEEVVNDGSNVVLVWHDVVEQLEGPEHIPKRDEEPSKEKGRKPEVHELEHSKDGVIKAHGQHLGHTFKDVDEGGPKQQSFRKSLRGVVLDGEHGDSNGKEGKDEHYRKDKDRLGEDIAHARHHAVLGLDDDALEFIVQCIDSNDSHCLVLQYKKTRCDHRHVCVCVRERERENDRKYTP